MAEQVLMPKQGNSVESCVILKWRKKEGETVSKGDILCEVESDKAAFEVESTVAGTLLKVYFEEGDDVPVYTPIAAVGDVGEGIPEAAIETTTGQRNEEAEPAGDTPVGLTAGAETPVGSTAAAGNNPTASSAAGKETLRVAPGLNRGKKLAASPRARQLAEKHSFDLSRIEGRGTGPGGRIIEQDVRAALDDAGAASLNAGDGYPGKVREYPVRGVRKIVSERMAASLRDSAQLTLHASADASSILAYRQKLKNSKKELELKDISLNDLVFFAAVKTVKRYPALNAHYLGDRIVEYSSVHAAFAVDTERGLTVPVVKFADRLSLKELSAEVARLGNLCIYGGIDPDDLNGGTFTVSNLGVLGVELFTPILNPPQTAILGVCNVQQKPVLVNGETVFHPHIGFSLTVDHQAVDGAPAARFLKSLCETIADFNLALA